MLSQSIFSELKGLLGENKDYTADGKLLKNKIIESALILDESLIRLLLSRERLKSYFFKNIDGVLVFDRDKFVRFVDNKEFLPDSYTAFKNKIGLAVDNSYLSRNKDVVLVWPYKDCVLEGGQEKSVKKRQEVFYNEILAPDEIDVLLEPKVFCNFLRIDREGKHEVLEIRSNDNLIIKGNNLLVLHSIKKRFAGKVKLIYIDPPYNTGNDEFQYNDNFRHSTWLTFMKNRLEAAKDLLREDGAIFVQCDDNEQAYLKVLMDEIFGRENFKEDIVVMMGSESGVNAVNVMRGEHLFKVKEHILYYAKNGRLHRFKPLYVRAAEYNDSYRWEVVKDQEGYIVTDVYKNILRDMFGQETLRGLSEEQKNLFYLKFREYCLKNAEKIYALKNDIQKSGKNFKKFAQENKSKGKVEEYRTGDGRTVLVYDGGMLSPLSERIVIENGKKYYGKLISDFWWDIGATPASEGNVSFKSGKKPEKLIKRIIELVTEPGDIVLDFFLGSGTTCAVAHKMGRQYIGIEQLDYGENSALARLKNVIAGEQTGISKSVSWLGGGSFIYMELAKINEVFIERIREAETTDDLINLWQEMKSSSFLSYKVDSLLFDENIEEFKNMNFPEQKRILAEILDKNNLYVNYSEIDDAIYNISYKDKVLNEMFYENDLNETGRI
ncbi:site-specific DNA-methyltransferase [Thermosyntropha sp.]|uniref:DNA methyltransferase n=1 Tax=Thermosyntropha sp. TaxID=2740820 RepID=UPI0025F523C9|nr:site-specific DNA-methyltransferase [Thermosyntropha sp.]MBO8158977.1 site-specific DNA-methyltransferase [Thermosyntropha sp.]